MTNHKKLTVEEMKEVILEEKDTTKLSLFLGNGFTQGKAEFTDFAQANILNEIKSDVQIKGLIEAKSDVCQNFEEYLRLLNGYPEFTRFFCDTDFLNRSGIGLGKDDDLNTFFSEKSAECQNLAADFKSHLLGFFNKKHPSSFNESSEGVRQCINFFSYFRRIFTINYDLLLYWIIQCAIQEGKRFRDGFGDMIEFSG